MEKSVAIRHKCMSGSITYRRKNEGSRKRGKPREEGGEKKSIEEQQQQQQQQQYFVGFLIVDLDEKEKN